MIPSRRQTLFFCLLLVGAILAVYWPVVHYPFINYDDPKYVSENLRVATGLTWSNVAWAFQTGHASNWHPLTWLSHMLDVQLFGLQAGGHHFVSLCIHIANTILLFLLLQRITGAARRSAIVAGLFALHPLHVESVAWIAERKDVLSTFFFMLTLWAYAKYVENRNQKTATTDHGPQTTDHVSRSTLHAPRYYVLSLILFTLGLMSKPMLVTLPFVLLLLDFWPLRRLQLSTLNSPPSAVLLRRTGQPSTPWRLLLLEKAPFFALTIASCMVTVHMQGKGAAMAPVQGFPIEDRLTNSIVSYLRYAVGAVWPSDLAIFYPLPGMLNPGSTQWPAGLVLAAILLVLGATLFSLRAWSRQPWFAMGWFWFLGTLIPVIGLVQVGSQAMADRYTYIPLIGLFIALVWSAAELIRPLDSQEPQSPGNSPLTPSLSPPAASARERGESDGERVPKAGEESVPGPEGRRMGMEAAYAANQRRVSANKVVVALVSVLVLAAMGAAAQRQVHYWQDDAALFEHTLAVTSEKNVPAHYCLGRALGRQGKYDLAIPHFRTVLEVAPDLSEARYHLALCLTSLGKLAEAADEYETALQVNPNHPLARNNLAVTLLALGKADDAASQFAELARQNPNSPDPHLSLGSIWLGQGKFKEAEAEFGEALRRQPESISAITGMGRALAAQGKFAEAQAQLREVVRLRPTNAEAHVNLGNTLIDSGQTNAAAACFATALILEPGLVARKLNEGKTLLGQGQGIAALVCFTIAGRLQPDNADVPESLGQFYAQQGKFEEAIGQFQRQLQLRPDAQAWYNLALTRVMQHDLKSAATNYEEAIKLRPDWALALNDLAWIRATAPQDQVRDGAEAVLLAKRACELSGEKEARFFGTLDAAYAEAGKFDDAIRMAEKTRQLAAAAGDKDLAAAAEQRLTVYRSGKPFRQ